ncbi:MAG: Na/Pi symporter, partial [Candidatus Marinimicrobia bacterium]|nr:Na/Pi symporter [Candidatus Neomarinimicrobiota bacterium]
MTSQSKLIKMLTIIVTIYLFLLSIKLLGHSFKQFKDLAEVMIKMTSNPFAGLIIGIVATSLIQSSSTTTAIVVGLVAGNALSLSNAIPIIMGANIGTTVTNTLVSLGHIKSREEFRRAFSASIVHDFFNICVVIVLFPVEMKFHIIERTASLLKHGFFGAGGLKMFNPLKIVLNPAISWLDHIFSLLPYKSALMIVFSLLLMFASLTFLVKTIRVLMLTKMEVIIGNYLFRNDIFGFIFGILMT